MCMTYLFWQRITYLHIIHNEKIDKSNNKLVMEVHMNIN